MENKATKEDTKASPDKPAPGPQLGATPPPETELSKATPQPTDAGSGQASGGFLSRFKTNHRPHNVYTLVFIVLLLIAGGTIFAAVKLSQNTGKSPKSQTLTDKQLADLKGSTTLVGDAQQVLDIQSNSVFEGQVLLKGSLDVAGSIKVGGGLNLPSITVGGISTFGTVGVNGDFSVAGNTTLQKGLTVGGAASFAGSVSAHQLNVSSLNLTGDLNVSRHITVSGGIPVKSNGTALGSGGTVSINGSDTAGTVTVNTGGSPPAGCFGTFSFSQKFSATPRVIVSPSNSSSAGLNYYTNRSTTSFSLCTANAPSGSTTYLFDYIVID